MKRITTLITAIALFGSSPLAVADALFNEGDISVLLNKHACNTKCSHDGYEITPIDLNNDGTLEYLVNSENGSGSAGSTQALFIHSGSGWKKLIENLGLIEVMKKRTKGFANIKVIYGKPEVKKIYRWDGKKYRTN